MSYQEIPGNYWLPVTGQNILSSIENNCIIRKWCPVKHLKNQTTSPRERDFRDKHQSNFPMFTVIFSCITWFGLQENSTQVIAYVYSVSSNIFHPNICLWFPCSSSFLMDNLGFPKVSTFTLRYIVHAKVFQQISYHRMICLTLKLQRTCRMLIF